MELFVPSRFISHLMGKTTSMRSGSSDRPAADHRSKAASNCELFNNRLMILSKKVHVE